ncbi:MAG: AsmA family protein [Wenzhouxiangella sp.]|nr:AsmA family protein [Wenzhouxiangella sp.]
MSMRNTFIVVAAAAIMMLGILGSGIIFLDEQRLKSLVAQHVENQTGRRLEIRGPLRVRLFPGLRISAEQVLMLPPEGFDGPELFSADRIDMQVRLLALVRSRVEASDVRLSGARINLHTDEQGRSSLEGLGRTRPAGVADWTSGPVTLENATLSFSDARRGVGEVLEMERIDLAGVAPGRPVEFRFRGNVEEPAAFDMLEVDGLLVPAANGGARLSNMRLLGSMNQGRYRIEVRGNVSYSAEPPMQLGLDGGIVHFNEHRFLIDASYLAGERPYLTAALATDMFDVDVLAVVQKLAELADEPADSGLMTALRGFDFDLSMAAGRVAELGMVLSDARFDLNGREGKVVLSMPTTRLPGGMGAAEVNLDLRRQRPAISAQLNLEVSRLESLLVALRLEPFLDGAGRVNMDLAVSPATASERLAAAWTGRGEIEMQPGEWLFLVGDPDQRQSGLGAFDRMHAKLLLGSQSVLADELSIRMADATLTGEIGFALSDRALFGSLQLQEQGRLELISLAGTLGHPILIRTPPQLLPAE